MEGKWFADSLDGAAAHGRALEGSGSFRLIEADVPNNAPSLFSSRILTDVARRAICT
jgi:hypothetical protein